MCAIRYSSVSVSVAAALPPQSSETHKLINYCNGCYGRAADAEGGTREGVRCMWKQASGAGEKKDPTRKSAEIQTILDVKRYSYMYSRIRKYAAISELKIERLLLNLAMRLPDGMFPVVNAGSYMNFPPLLLLPTRIPSLPCLSPLNVIIAILHCCFLLLLLLLPSKCN